MVNVGILLGDMGNSFWHAMRREYESLAPEQGIAVTIRWAEVEKDPQAQTAVLSVMVDQGFDALIVNPIACDNLAAPIMRATRSGLPVLDVGAKTDSAAVSAAGDLYVPVLTVDFAEQGHLGGAYIAERLNASGRDGVVVGMHGRRGSKQSIGRVGGARQVLESHDQVREFVEVYGEFDEKAAARETERLLVAEDVTAFFCANDLMAVSVASRRRETGSDAVVVGVDGTPEGLAAVERGLLDATVAFSAHDVATVLLKAVRDVLEGRDAPAGHTVASRLVCREGAR